MKKTLLILVALATIISMGAFAQVTDSASLFLSGTVGDFVSITVTPEPAATGLTLSVAQTTPLLVATVTESSNTGYNVVATSANSFNFSDGSASLPYQMYYDGALIAASGDTVTTGSSASSVARPITVTFPAAPGGATPGSYSDTVTFTISSP
jgi:spore coat protein U-like protein